MEVKHQDKNIKKIICYTTRLNMFETSKKEEAPEFVSMVEAYDKKGNLAASCKYFEDGGEDERAEYGYDDKGRVTSEIVHYALSESSEERRVEYNDQEKKSEETQYFGVEPGERVITRYNDDEEPLEVIQYDEEGELMQKNIFEYHKPGKVRLEEEYDGDENLVKRIRSEYNDEGHVISKQVYMGSEAEEQLLTIEREEKREVTTATTPDDDLLYKITQDYDDNGNVVEITEEHFSMGYEKRVLKREFDDKNNLTLHEVYDGGGNIMRRLEYKYDENGLMIEEVTFINNLYMQQNDHYVNRYEYEIYD